MTYFLGPNSLQGPHRSIFFLNFTSVNLTSYCSVILLKNDFLKSGSKIFLEWPAILNLNLPIGQWPIFLNRSNSLWQATLNLISVNLNLILFWNPAEKCFGAEWLEILNLSAYDRPVNLHYFVETNTRGNSEINPTPTFNSMTGDLEFEVIQSEPHNVLKSCSTSVPKK